MERTPLHRSPTKDPPPPGQVEKPQRTCRGQLNSHGCVLLFQASPSPIIVNTDTLEPGLSVSLPPLLESLPSPEGLAHFQEAALLGCPLGGLRCLEPKVGGGIDRWERSLLKWACQLLERVAQTSSLGNMLGGAGSLAQFLPA